MIRIAETAVQPFEIAHIEAVRGVAPECTVLLKSDGSLPWVQPGKLALYGNGVRKTIKGGTGSGDVNVRHFVNAEEGLKNAGFEITSNDWLDGYDRIAAKARKEFVNEIKEQARTAGMSPVMLGMGRVMPEPNYELALDGAGDSAVYVLARNSGEGSDRQDTAGDIGLTETEIRDILAINEKYEHFVLALNVGGMVDLKPVKDVKNILLLGQLGTPTGDVLADLLLGKSYPSGKLTMTWASIPDYPSTEGFGDINDTYYKEGIYVGYRYFDSANVAPMYPFGYGLGYTTFTIKIKDIQADEQQVSVMVSVKNTGDKAGKEIVQVYWSAPTGKLDQPYQQLGGFAKTGELQPQEEAEVTVTFATASMASYDTAQAAYLMEPGQYMIRVGNCSRNTKICGIILLNEAVVTEQVKNICSGWDFTDDKPTVGTFSYDSETAEMAAAPVFQIAAGKMQTNTIAYSKTMQELSLTTPCTWPEVKAGTKTVDEYVAGLSNEQLAALCIGAYSETAGAAQIIGSAAFAVAGAAGETTHKLDESRLDQLVMADGPAGIRVSKGYKLVGDEVKASDNALAALLTEFMGPEELQAMAAMTPPPTQEELDALEYYQYCVAIPIGTDLAQSWNMEVIKTLGDIVGTEMEMFGVHLWLAPALNIHRSPLCGRNFEYYSEDPLVSGMVAAAMTSGVKKHPGCGTTIKHFACNNQETNRYTSNSIVSERALREIYLKGFEICVRQSQPQALMSSYNLINGEHACNSKDILTDVLRDEWGFEGIVMTDWLVTSDAMKNPAGKHTKGSAAGCVKAGNDLTMPGMAEDKEDILDALKNPDHAYALSRAELQTCAVRILYTILKLTK